MSTVDTKKAAAIAVLEAARALHSGPEKWTKRAFARDDLGNGTEPESELACQFCVLGAIKRAHSDLGHDEAEAEKDAIYAVVEAIGMWSVETWNDAKDRTFDHVKDMWDHAIGSLKGVEVA